jgi:competence protein ComEC
MKLSKYFIYLLSLLMLLSWLVVFSLPDDKLHVISCNVGEGDATLIVNGSNQVLIDGGPNNKVIDCLSRYVPFWDRTLETIILTHPDHDHMGGLSLVLSRYKVKALVENQVDISKPEYQALEKLVGGDTKRVTKFEEGTHLRVGLIYLDLFTQETSVTNDASIVSELIYGNFKALFTGDATAQVLEKYPLEPVNYIKVPHHGAKTGLTQVLLELLSPKVAVISVGKNGYGHPTPEILSLLKENNIQVLRTDEVGNVEVISDGKGWWVN